MNERFKPVEFYRDRTGTFVDCVNIVSEPDARSFDSLDVREVFEMIDHLFKFPNCRSALLFLAQQFGNDKRKVLKQFVQCNFSNLDRIMDITQDSVNPENVPCQYKSKGKCPIDGKGIVCLISKVRRSVNFNNLLVSSR